jgi:hypothetical protein
VIGARQTFANQDPCHVTPARIAYDGEHALIPVMTLRIQCHTLCDQSAQPLAGRSSEAVFLSTACVNFGRIRPYDPNAPSSAIDRIAVDYPTDFKAVHRRRARRQQPWHQSATQEASSDKHGEVGFGESGKPTGSTQTAREAKPDHPDSVHLAFSAMWPATPAGHD